MINIPITILELEENSFHLLVKCQIDSDKTGEMIVDTGASKTVLDKKFVPNYQSKNSEKSQLQSKGLGGENLDTEMVEIHSFRMGKFQTRHFPCALIDLSEINRMYLQQCNREICGLLGSDFLLKHHATIDYRKKILRIKKIRQK